MQKELHRREEIHRVAAGLFFRKGYTGTSMRDLASSVGIQQSALYHHYPSKSDILYDIMKQGITDLRATVEDNLKSATNTIEELNIFLATHVRHSLTRRGEAGIGLEMRHLDPEQRSELRQLNQEYIGLLREIMNRGIRENYLRRCNVRFVSILLLNAATFIAAWFDPNGPLTVDEIVDIYMDQNLRGLLKDK